MKLSKPAKLRMAYPMNTYSRVIRQNPHIPPISRIAQKKRVFRV